jgi:hypothetical protein
VFHLENASRPYHWSRHHPLMGNGRTQSTKPDLFLTASLAEKRLVVGTAAAPPQRYVLPRDPPVSISDHFSRRGIWRQCLFKARLENRRWLYLQGRGLQRWTSVLRLEW